MNCLVRRVMKPWSNTNHGTAVRHNPWNGSPPQATESQSTTGHGAIVGDASHWFKCIS
jgi:hypothetical protein